METIIQKPILSQDEAIDAALCLMALMEYSMVFDKDGTPAFDDGEEPTGIGQSQRAGLITLCDLVNRSLNQIQIEGRIVESSCSRTGQRQRGVKKAQLTPFPSHE
ncbi:MAG: hypothetical protein LBO05_04175 [Deltaproteobacteria bacterium]|jgi:hypothetical protein|nr:hypothetical protein [Deltaproteobacteria bacterium]